MGLFDFLTKSFSEKEIDKIRPQVDAVLALEGQMEACLLYTSDAADE